MYKNHLKINYLFSQKLDEVNLGCCKILLLQSDDCELVSFNIGRSLIFIEKLQYAPCSKNNNRKEQFLAKYNAKKKRYTKLQFCSDILMYIHDIGNGVIFVLTKSGNVFVITVSCIVARIKDEMEVDCSDSDIFTTLLTNNPFSTPSNFPMHTLCSVVGAYNIFLVDGNLYILFVNDGDACISVCTLTKNEKAGSSVTMGKQNTYHVMQRPITSLPQMFLISENVVDKLLYTNILGPDFSPTNQLCLFCCSNGAIYHKSLQSTELTLFCDVKQRIKDFFVVSLKEVSCSDRNSTFPSSKMPELNLICDSIKSKITANNCLCFISYTGKLLSVFFQSIESSSRLMFSEQQFISPVLCCDARQDVLAVSNGIEICLYQLLLKVRLLNINQGASELKKSLNISLEYKLLRRISVPDIENIILLTIHPFEVIAYRQGKLMLLTCDRENILPQSDAANLLNDVEVINESISELQAKSNKSLEKLFELSIAVSIFQQIKKCQRLQINQQFLPIDVGSDAVICGSKKKLLLTCKITNNSNGILPKGFSINISYFKTFAKYQTAECKGSGEFNCKSETISLPTMNPKEDFKFCNFVSEEFIAYSPIVFDFYLIYSFNSLCPIKIQQFGGACHLKSHILDIPDVCAVIGKPGQLDIMKTSSKHRNLFHILQRGVHNCTNKDRVFSVILSKDLYSSSGTTDIAQKSSLFSFLFGKVPGDPKTLLLLHLNGENVIMSYKEIHQHFLLTFTSNNIFLLAWIHNFVLCKWKKYLVTYLTNEVCDHEKRIRKFQDLLKNNWDNSPSSRIGINIEKVQFVQKFNSLLDVYSNLRRVGNFDSE